jgi:hypothetical protein
MNMQIVGMQQLLTFLGDLGDKAPRQALAKGVRKGANNILRDAKGDAPVYSGTMQHSLKLKTETGNRKKLKVVIDVTFDSGYTYHFKGQDRTPPATTDYYYPGSQEYGFRTKNGGFVPGKYFMKKARDDNDGTFTDIVEQALNDEIDRLG